MHMQAIVKKILPVTLGNINGLWQHFTFCCLDHSDLNSLLKNLNTSNTSLTLGEPHMPKHILSTLTSKHDSICKRKICIWQKNHNSETRIHLTGDSEFSKISKLPLCPVFICFTYTNEKSRYLEFSQLTDYE